MARKLNPHHIRRIMERDELRGLEVVILTGPDFGVSTRNESLLVDGEWIDKDAPNRCHADRMNYRGWTRAGRLYCRKCWSPILGIPRDIIQRNWCASCKSRLYAPDDDEHFDLLGYEIYRRDRVTRYMGLAVRSFRDLIEGAEHIWPNGLMDPGYHKDHIFSVRDAFENDIQECVVSSPPNLRVVTGRKNISKNRKSDCMLEELLEEYERFLLDHPEWLELVKRSDESEETFVFEV